MWKELRYQRNDRPASVKAGMAMVILCYVSFLLYLVIILGSVPLREDHPLKGAE